MFKKLLVFLAASSLTLLLYLTAFTSILVLTITPDHVKSWLRSSNVYNTVVDDLVQKSQTAIADKPDSESSFNKPEVQAAIKKTFTPEFLQTSTEQFIDGITPWLKGKSAKPTFSIDLGGAKLAFIDSFAEQARARYASLPACAKGQVPDTSDPMNISCQPKGYSIEAGIAEAKSKLTTSQEFLPNSVLTADTITKGEGANKKPVFDGLEEVPKAYQWARRAPFIFGVLALIAAAVIIFLSTIRRKGIRRVLTSLVLAALPLLAMLWALGFGVRKLEAAITKSAAKNNGLENTGITLAKEVQGSLKSNIIIFATAFLAIAAGLLIYLIVTRGKKPHADASKEESHKSESAEEKPPEHAEAEKAPKPKPPKLVQ